MAKKRNRQIRSDRDFNQRKKPRGGGGWATNLLRELKEGNRKGASE